MTEKSITSFGFAAGIIISAFAVHISSRLCFAVRCQARGFLLANQIPHCAATNNYFKSDGISGRMIIYAVIASMFLLTMLLC